jgi:paraquat-inducible protein A
VSARAATAVASGCLLCEECELLCRAPAHAEAAARCPRCGAALHPRKPRSLERTWAFVLAAWICYLPANLFPIMTVRSLGSAESDTILGGIIYLFTHGMWPLALIVFVASFCVPLLKLLILVGLLGSVHLRSRWRPAERTRLHRFTLAIGRWSMVDVFAVTILVALVHLGAVASIEAELGAVFFGAVVVLTMLGAEAFDPRLLWDPSDARTT